MIKFWKSTFDTSTFDEFYQKSMKILGKKTRDKQFSCKISYFDIMDERLFILKGILKRIGNFDVKTLNGRLLFQKAVYFLQVFRFNLGYKFNWYIYGPYSSGLAKDGFSIKDLKDVPEMKFVNSDFEIIFQQFDKFLSTIKNDPRKMELLASIDFLRRLNPDKGRDFINLEVKKKQTHFEDNEIIEAWDYLAKFEEFDKVS